ncbi:MAG: carboxypeptidase-like regulatory domain-containing protein, partial [Cytophagales bacterium]|nr:carboxypeptidase-like regulatory domain-containing protein [Cytophagales bacterium]
MFKFRMAIFGCLLSLQAIAQFNMRGFVRDAKNEPLVGATVKLVRQGAVAITDSGGNFLFNNLKEATYEGEVRYVGYQTKRLTLSASESNVILLDESVIVTDEVLVTATRAAETTPTTFSNISKSSIQKQNFGQDLPFVLNWSPSIVTTSDAGAGVGYTGLRIRGSDATRINVTINGIPLNDSESQG